MISTIIILHLITSIMFAFLLMKVDWLYCSYYGFGELTFTGFVSLFWPIILPVFLIGYIGYSVSNIGK